MLSSEILGSPDTRIWSSFCEKAGLEFVCDSTADSEDCLAPYCPPSKYPDKSLLGLDE
jgi:hypothetical protein